MSEHAESNARGSDDPGGTKAIADRRADKVILDERARHLARPAARADTVAQTREVLVFRRGRERFAIEAKRVALVARLGAVARVPGAPTAIAGATTHQGEVLAVADLDRLLGLTATPSSETQPWLLLVGEGADAVAVVADEVEETRSLSLADFAAPDPSAVGVAWPDFAAAPDAPLRQGVTREGVTLLDARALLSDPRLRPTPRRR